MKMKISLILNLIKTLLYQSQQLMKDLQYFTRVRMSDYDDVKKKLAIQISVLFTCICFGGVICIIIATAVVGTNTCEDICGAKYPEEDTNCNCCTNNKYNECVQKGKCGQWQTVFLIGLYIIVGSIVLCCCCVAAVMKQQESVYSGGYSAAPVRKRKFLILEVND